MSRTTKLSWEQAEAVCHKPRREKPCLNSETKGDSTPPEWDIETTRHTASCEDHEGVNGKIRMLR